MTPDAAPVSRLTFCREAIKTARVLPVYPLPNIDARRLRLFEMWRSEEALKLVREAGLEVPR